MDEIKVDSIRVRQDLIGDFEKTNKLKGYAAECFLKRILRENEEAILDYLKKKWNIAPYMQYLSNFHAAKYKSYLADKEARQYIYDKYAEKESTIDILCGRITDLTADECLELVDFYEEIGKLLLLIDKIVQPYLGELRATISDDITKVRKML